MGMYDDVEIDPKYIPDELRGIAQLIERPFQTKYFENVMATYYLTNRLYCNRAMWSQRDIERHDTNFHGIFELHSGHYVATSHPEIFEYWYVSLEAKYTDGDLVYLKLLEHNQSGYAKKQPHSMLHSAKVEEEYKEYMKNLESGDG